jgi:hypothetical protein
MVMDRAGMSKDEQTALGGLLEKNKNITWQWGQSSPSDVQHQQLNPFAEGFGEQKKWADPGYGALSDQLMKEWQAKQPASAGDNTIAGLQAADAAAKAAADKNKPAAAPTVDPNKVYPAYSKQELQEYTQDYVMPIQRQMANMIQGDMSQWQGAINNIASATGQQNSPITKLMAANASEQAPLYKLLGNVTNQAALNTPYYNMVNNAVGAATTIGNRQLALGSAAQNLYAYGLIDPTSAALGGQSSGILGTNASTSANSLLAGLMPQAAPGTTVPGQ